MRSRAIEHRRHRLDKSRLGTGASSVSCLFNGLTMSAWSSLETRYSCIETTRFSSCCALPSPPFIRPSVTRKARPSQRIFGILRNRTSIGTKFRAVWRDARFMLLHVKTFRLRYSSCNKQPATDQIDIIVSFSSLDYRNEYE